MSGLDHKPASLLGYCPLYRIYREDHSNLTWRSRQLTVCG